MKLIIAAAFLLGGSCCLAQNNIIPGIIKNNLILQPVYNISPVVTEQSFSIACEFGKPTLFFKNNEIDPAKVQVTAIDLVFTDYPSTDNLIKLNTERLQNLFTKYPGIASNKSIAWKLVRQTNGRERAAAIELFHGFVIYYRPLQNDVTLKSDLAKLKDMLTPKDGPAKKRNGFVTGDTTELRKQYEIEEYTTVKKLPVSDALQFLGIAEREKITYKNYDSLFVYLKPSTDSFEKRDMKPPVDSTVLKVFDRMQWNKMLVVADVTASTYPFTGQLLLWLKLHEEERRINQFVFFNDGDDKEDENKVTGNTGGIYTTASSVFEVIEQLVYKAMSNGNGGNIPENNIEALLAGLKACTACESIVMVSDNSSVVSDMILLNSLNKPIHIVLCGVHDVITTDYLDIARSTGGSVHLAEEDILQLASLKEGEKIIIKGKLYKIKNGKFIKTE